MDKKKDERKPIDLKQAYRNIIRAFGLIWQSHASGTLAMAGVTLIAAALPLAQAYLGKLIIDGVAVAAQSGVFTTAGLWAGIQPVLPYLAAELFLVTLGAAASQVRSLVEHVLHARLSHDINTAIIRKSLTLDLQFFEDAEFYDKLQQRPARSRPARACRS